MASALFSKAFSFKATKGYQQIWPRCGSDKTLYMYETLWLREMLLLYHSLVYSLLTVYETNQPNIVDFSHTVVAAMDLRILVDELWCNVGSGSRLSAAGSDLASQPHTVSGSVSLGAML